jgi:hypothetical protein
LLPIDGRHIDTVKGVNSAGLSELSSPERLSFVDLEVQDFKSSYEQLPTVRRDDYVIPKDGHFPFERLKIPWA